MASFNKFESFVGELGFGTHQLHAAGHTLKIFLTNEQPLAADTVKADMAEITNEHGYAPADIQNDYTETAGVGTLTGVDVVFTAAGGSFGPFQFVVLYNDTAASDELIGWWDYGSAITCLVGETFTTDFGASILTVT